MEQQSLGEFSSQTKLESFSKEELIRRYSILEDELARVVRELYTLRKIEITDMQLNFILSEQLEDLKNKIFGASSEKRAKKKEPKDNSDDPIPPKPRIKKPSERYPDLPVVPQVIPQNPPPSCNICGNAMKDSGMTDDSEQLTVIPKKYEISLIKKVIYNCGCCHGSIQTTPSPERIKEGSTYSDEMIIDVSLSKFCDLIPIERQAAMAKRTAAIDIPPHSLIECTHYLAEFVLGAYLKLEDQLLLNRNLSADETPHRMLEGDPKKAWYLWGFSTAEICFFECHNTRSGDVASEILIKSQCEFLLTDVYSGYNKAVRIANEERLKEGKPPIKNAFCNAHARRYFFKSFNDGRGDDDAEFYLDLYQEIYKLNEACKGKTLVEILELRSQMKSYFEAMRVMACENIHRYSDKSKFGKAMSYFLKNYEGLTLCLLHPEIPLDNNSQERLLRSHVVGRKTWYGTHSKRGAETAAILFSLVETCKLNQVNPREYFKKLVSDMLAGHAPFTPCEFKALLNTKL